MASKSLTDTSIKALKSSDRTRKITVGGCPGLVLMVSPAGSKVFRLQYLFEGKSQLFTIGPYPSISLSQARMTALLHREDIKKGINPAKEKRESKAKAKAVGRTFRAVAEEWLKKSEPGWSDVHVRDTRQKLNCHILPRIGDKPIVDVDKAAVKEILDTLDARGKIPTIKKVRGIISQVFNYALANDIPGVTFDPTTLLRGKGIFTAHRPQHRAALTAPKDVARLMKAIFSYEETSLQTCIALKFSALAFCRPGEIRHAEWAEFDFEDGLWRIPAEKMKMAQPHLVPLAAQAIKILEYLRPMTGHSRYLFPSLRSPDRPMSEATITAALRRMGFSREEMVAHGFRGMASSRLNEMDYNRDWI